MSYQVLARKWRSRSFQELVGQSHVLQALVNALDQNRLHHAYLFTGTRGVGKTTIARILAKCLNCETGVSSTPCGQCSACREIDEGRFVDLIEVDAASRTKVEDTRELLDNVQYAPTRGRFKVYLIDEVHMLSAHSFNALLKTLEEPPPHVKFLLATTDPQKLPVTILSRCLQFSLKNMTPELIVGHLKNILTQEQLAYEVPALWQLARAADGSMRDALSLTDQAIAFGNGQVMEAEVSAMLGTIDQRQVLKMVQALATGNAATILTAVGHLAEHAPDYRAVLDDMLAVLHRVAIAQVVPEAIDNSQGDRELVVELAAAMTAEDVQLFYQVGLVGKKDLPLAPEPRSGFEMALLRMLAFRPDGAPASTQTLRGSGNVASVTESSSDAGEAAGNSEPEPEPAVVPQITEVAPEPELVEEPAPSTVPALEPLAEPAPAMMDSFEPPAPLPEAEAPAKTVVAKPEVVAEPEHQPIAEPEEPPPLADVPLDAYDSMMSDSSSDMGMESEPAPAAPEGLEGIYDRVSPEELSAVTESVVQTPEVLTPVKRIPEMPSVEERVGLADLNQTTWVMVFRGLPVGGVTGTLGSHCEFLGYQNGELALRLDQQTSTLYNDSHRQRIEKALSDYFRQPIKVLLEIAPVTSETPAVWRDRKIAERLREAKDSIYNDAQLQALINEFSGMVLDDSIQPIGNIIK